VAALLSDRAPLSALRRAVGDVHIEDLLVPLFIPATDIRHARRVVFDRGPLWRALRATTSLPLVWSPLLHEGQVLVDGGLMSNQPLDLLLPTCGEGLVLAHDLLPPPEHNRSLLRPEPEGPPTGLRDRLRRRLQRAVGPLRLPNVALHAMTIPSYQAQAAFDAGQAPPAVRSVRPELHDYGFFEVDQAEADALIASVHTQSLTTLSSLGDPHA
jgi:predicted acylesterase/phospholipase RssA